MPLFDIIEGVIDDVAVDSSNLSRVAYNPLTSTLRIEFHQGAIYEYYSVSLEAYVGLINADSKGSYFHSFINGTYDFSRVT